MKAAITVAMTATTKGPTSGMNSSTPAMTPNTSV
jgi:hypothetical protein